MAIKLFTENPSAFWASFPELANAIEVQLQSSSRSYKRVPVFENYMTEREREFKLRSLSEMTERYRTSGTLQLEEGRRALELAAALREHAEPYKETLLKVVEHVLGMPLNSQDPEKIVFEKGKSEHHTFELARGLTQFLAWDGGLIRIELDPKEYQYRQKALSFVGVAADSQHDVAWNHDMYLWATPDGQ